MIISKLFLRRYFILALIFSPVISFAQGKLKSMKDSVILKAFPFYRGDTILVELDTIYAANNRTLKTFQSNYANIKNKNTVEVTRLENTYDSLITVQQNQIDEKEKYYQQLKSTFDSVISTSNSFVDKTDANVTDINQSLTRATGEINNIKSLLDDSLAKLKAENAKRLKLAVGGFAVGVGIASLIFLVAK